MTDDPTFTTMEWESPANGTTITYKWLDEIKDWKLMTEYRTGDPRFHDLLDEIAELHDRKQADYGTEGDPFANVRASQDWGVPAWVGTMIRANDKVKRLQAAAQGSTLLNEGVEDSLMDIATYALIALVLYREQDDNTV